MIKFIREKFRKLRYNLIFLGKEQKLSYSYISNSTINNKLTELMNFYGSDKGGKNNHHNYTNYYSDLFTHRKNDIKNFLEIGIGTNNEKLVSNMGSAGVPLASLRAWRDYFINADIYGADIDKKILQNEDRIRTFYVDQTNPNSIKELFRNIGKVKFDVILDDGFHQFEANICFFENSIKHLDINGMYIIEDVHYKNHKKFIDYFKSKKYDFSLINIYHKNNYKNNCIIIIRIIS